MSSGYRYRMGPFALQSDVALPVLAGTEGGAGIPVRIELQAARVGAVPETAIQVMPGVWAWEDGALLRESGVGSFLVTLGARVEVALEAGAPAADVQSYLLGWCMGILCHQNGLLPLHACAVANDAGTVAFSGQSGAGKSTLAACLRRVGYRLVSDDICLLRPDADRMQVIPMAGWIKLWQTSLDYLGETGQEANRTFAEDEKFRLLLAADEREAPPLRRVVLLTRAPEAGAEPRLEQLSAPEALSLMIDHVYLGYCLEAMGIRARVFQQCGRVLAEAQAFRLLAPWGLERIEKTVRFVERELLKVLKG